MIISKTFTTAETMLNGRTLKVSITCNCACNCDIYGSSFEPPQSSHLLLHSQDWLVSAISHKVSDPSKIVSSHMVAVSTSSEKCTEFGIAPNNIFGK